MTEILLATTAITAWGLILETGIAWLTSRFPLGTFTAVGGNGAWAEDEEPRRWDRGLTVKGALR